MVISGDVGFIAARQVVEPAALVAAVVDAAASPPYIRFICVSVPIS